jgi:tetratricopeptide (TPR) repeat protein
MKEILRRGGAGSRAAPAALFAMAALFALAALLPAACARDREAYLEPLKRMEPGEGKKVSDRQIDELKAAIRRYQAEVDRKVRATQQLGIYYRMLAVRYIDLQMYQPAYEALEQARAIYPENAVLFYYSAVCAARLAQAQTEPARRGEWLGRSERLYRRAVVLDPDYPSALYGLAVLYVFELDRAQEAVDLLEHLLEKQKNNSEAMFLLGNVYYRLGKPEKALELYNRLVRMDLSADKRREAEANKRRIEEELHGAP